MYIGIHVSPTDFFATELMMIIILLDIHIIIGIWYLCLKISLQKINTELSYKLLSVYIRLLYSF